MGEFRERYGPWALVAGASEGLGAAWASEAAARGLDVALAARRRGPLEATAARLRAEHGVATRCLEVDLGAPDLVERVSAATDDLEIGCLVYNAASVTPGAFEELPLERHLDALAVNCGGLVRLCHHFGRPMAARGRGAIAVMSSGAALAGGGYMALYSATKSFDLSLAESLWCELSPKGVHVLAVIAGATDTASSRATGLDFGRLGWPVMEPGDVAREAFDHLADGPSWIPGDHNRERFAPMQSAPRRTAALWLTAANRRLYGFE